MFLEIFQKGGPLMWLILLCSVTALAAFFERVLFFHRASISTPDFLRGLGVLIERRSYDEAAQESAGTPGPAARVAYAILKRSDAPRVELKEIAQEAAQLEMPRLERNLPLLSTLAYVTPLIGLLGTVLGLIDSFSIISAHGSYGTAAEIAGGVYQSLVTSGAALAVAIPAFVGFSYLNARVDGFARDMERVGIELVQKLSESKK